MNAKAPRKLSLSFEGFDKYYIEQNTFELGMVFVETERQLKSSLSRL